MTSVVEENIYHLLNSTSTNRSNDSNLFRQKKKTENSSRTMGPAEVTKPNPCHPLRRRQNLSELPKVMPFVRPHRLPPIPKLDQQQKSLSIEKDFIRENITKINNSLPTCPRRFVVSDRKGNKYLIDGSGLQKDFILKKTYGKIPSYLRTRQSTNELPIQNLTENKMILLPEEERLCLIQNLKIRYEQIFAEYQRLPLRPETASSLMRKKYLTDILIEFEQDIGLLEKHQQIFIVENYSDVKNLQKTCLK